jgi:hypothetical protein
MPKNRIPELLYKYSKGQKMSRLSGRQFEQIVLAFATGTNPRIHFIMLMLINLL